MLRVGFNLSVSRALAAVSDPIGSLYRQGAAAFHYISDQKDSPAVLFPFLATS